MADALLVLHFLIAGFIVLGLILVWIGAAFRTASGSTTRWAWIRDPWFRYLHLAAIAFVAAEALLGYACPLTLWEDLLRGGARPETFVGRWVYRFLYYDAPEWIFTTLYTAWATATLLTLGLAPPRRKESDHSAGL